MRIREGRGRECCKGRECSLGRMLREGERALCIIVAKNRQKRGRGKGRERGDVLLPLLLLVTSANKMTAPEELGRGHAHMMSTQEARGVPKMQIKYG